jgi:TonB family protein
MKFKILPNPIFSLILILVFGVSVFSQTTSYAVPVKWQNYSTGTFKAVFLMPKLPIAVNESSYCRGEESVSYGTYADGVGYIVRITRKIDAPKFCAEKKEFDKTNFEDRVTSLKSSQNTMFAMTEREAGKTKSNEIILDGNGRITRLINDFENKRWFELTVYGADESKPEVKNFFSSLKVSNKAGGVEIFDGAERTLGDEAAKGDENPVKREPETAQPVGPGLRGGSGNSAITPKTETSSDKSVIEPLRIILKPRSNYTDAARSGQTQGKVVLRVTFQANGGIGAISVVSGLPDGLTEQAIRAAQRIVFIPPQKNGVRYSTTKSIEYSFTIY